MAPRDVAEQLLFMMDEVVSYEDALRMPTVELAAQLRSAAGADLLAVVDGQYAEGGCVLATLGASVAVPPTGAARAAAEAMQKAKAEAEADPEDLGPEVPSVPGDGEPSALVQESGVRHAFYGGLLASLYYRGGVPTEVPEIELAGGIANATANACLRNLFSLPDMANAGVLEELNANDTIAAVLSAEENRRLGNQADSAAPSEAMEAYHSSYAEDAGWAERLAEISGLHGRGGDAARAALIVEALVACHEAGGTVVVSGDAPESGVARRLSLSLASLGLRAQFAASGEGSAELHGWARTVRGTDVVICVSHAGDSGTLVEAVGTLRAVQGLPSGSSEPAPGADEGDGAETAAAAQAAVVVSILAGCARSPAALCYRQTLTDVALRAAARTKWRPTVRLPLPRFPLAARRLTHCRRFSQATRRCSSCRTTC